MSALSRAAHRFHGPDIAVVLVAVMAAAGIGAVVAWSPILALVCAAGAAGVMLISMGTRMIPVFHGALIVVLIGYAFLGKGMAYVGAAPLYVGEVVLALAVLAILVALPTARWQPAHLVIGLFMAWGLVTTIPYLATYDIDALRDGVSYGYAVFAFAVSLTVVSGHLGRLVRLYRRWIPLFVGWVPIAAVLVTAFGPSLPLVPGSDIAVVMFKGGDAGVHLAAIGAFLLLGVGGEGVGHVRDAVIWAGWIVAVGVAGALNRGGLLAASMMGVAVLFGRGAVRWGSLVVVGLFLVAVVGLTDPQVDVGLYRRLSAEQVVANVLSVFGGGGTDPVLEGTKQWRLAWWDEIIGYTIGGDFMWTGKGFGINLADADGFQVTADGSLRAPHNGHLELLARGGVPMIVLWIAVQVAFLVTMLRAAGRARRSGQVWLIGIVGWIVVYWLAALVNASFDVYLQNPMGGIWYWSMLGLGLAVARVIADETVDPSSGGVRPAGPAAGV